MKKPKYTSNRETEKINQIMMEYIHKQNWRSRLLEANAVHIYNRLPDEAIKNCSKAFKVVDHELFIHVESPVYSHQLTFMSQEIITKINEKLKYPAIRKLRFQVAKIEREDRILKVLDLDPTEGVLLNDDDRRQLTEDLSGIEDKDLHDDLNHLYTNVLKRNKGKS
ncbi:MAG: hypothetical protein IEMM0008_0638 [bacterium]|nr:MAG: hypothetical protein IEMM0008_0638 [bacterium]